MSTSGSTVSPFTSYQNIEKKRRVNAETIFFNGMAGYKVGNSLINLRSLNAKRQKSKIKQRIQNEQLINIEKLDKTDIEVLPGDNLIFRIRVFNEGDILGTAERILEYIPETLEFNNLSKINKNIPLHLSRYYPSFKFKDEATDIEKMKTLRDLAKEYLNYVYIGNVLEVDNTTYCRACGEVLVKRTVFEAEDKNIKNTCRSCGKNTNIIY